MGRWLTALKKHENAQEANCQNRQNPVSEGFGSFVSGPPERNEKIPRQSTESASEVLSVLSVPLLGEIENSHGADDDADERAAVLEYDGGLRRDEAEQAAGVRPEPIAAPKSDAELYAEALRRIQPCGYGPVAAFLGWGMTRAANAETVLREAGRIRYDHSGRGVFVDGPIPSQATGEKS